LHGRAGSLLRLLTSGTIRLGDEVDLDPFDEVPVHEV
jgi:MOSC domain-containing protein YiiM